MDSPDLEGATSKMFEGNNTDDAIEFMKNQGDLSFGLDLSDDGILREGPSSNLSLSLIFERRKISKTFKLTPVLREPKKDIVNASDSKEEEVLDLSTPQQGITVNHGTSCPGRPIKSHKLVLPSAEKSCRHLFTEESCHITLDSDFEPGKQEELGQASYRKHKRESKEKVKETDVCDEEENWGKTANPEDGNQSSFSCNLSTCSKSSCDVTSCSSSPCLSSPNLSKIKGAKRTIESSYSDVEIQVNEDHNSQTSILEDQELESDNQEGDDVFISPSVSQKPQVSSDTANKIINNVVSSTDGTPSNWTLVSGVSPLPSSDPSHLQQYLMHRIHHHHHHHNHHNHHHHHHHHHNHHHHHHWHQKNKENNCNRDNSINAKLPENFSEDGPVLTSTPIRLKAAVNKLDVSSIKNRRSMDEVVGDFVISSELQVSNSLSRSSTYTSDDDENFAILQQRNIDETNHPVKRMLAIYHYSEDETSDKKLKLSGADLDLSDYKKKFAGQTPYVRRLTKEEVELLQSKPENFSDEVWYKSPSPLEGLPGAS